MALFDTIHVCQIGTTENRVPISARPDAPFSSQSGRPISTFFPRAPVELFASQTNFTIPAARHRQLGPMLKTCGTGEGILH